MLTGQNDGNNGMIAASLADMQKVRDEEKAALLELFGQQTNRMNMNMNMGGGMPQNQHSIQMRVTPMGTEMSQRRPITMAPPYSRSIATWR